MVDGYLVLKLSLKILKFCSATLNRFLVIGYFQLQYDCLGQVHFKPSDLRCEIIVMPLKRVLGPQIIIA